MKPVITVIILAFMLSITACKKDQTAGNPGPVDSNPRIAVKLNAGYLPVMNLDSAIFIWEINGQINEEKMQVANDTLFVPLSTLTEGSGKLRLQLFTKIKLNQQSLQWEKTVDVTLKHQQSVFFNAPVNLNDTGWFPRVILVDAPSKFTAIIALRPEDPYFLLKNVPPGFKIELERHYVTIPGGANIVGGGTWKCNTVCTDARGMIENRTYFSGLPAQINGREWKMVEAGVGLFGPNNTSGPGFYFNYY